MPVLELVQAKNYNQHQPELLNQEEPELNFSNPRMTRHEPSEFDQYFRHANTQLLLSSVGRCVATVPPVQLCCNVFGLPPLNCIPESNWPKAFQCINLSRLPWHKYQPKRASDLEFRLLQHQYPYCPAIP